MRIAFDSQIFWMQKYGGISRYFVSLCKYINDVGHKAKIFAPIHTNEYTKSLGKDFYVGKYIAHIPYGTERCIGAVSDYISNTLISKWSADIVHRTYYNMYNCLHVPSVLTVYDLIHEIYPQSFVAKDKTVFLKKRAIERADHIICISKSTQSDLMNYYDVKEQNTSVVHLGFQLQNSELRNDDPRILNEPYLLFVGKRDGYKNFRTFVQAVASSKVMNSMKIVCFGGGAFSAREKDFINSVGGIFSRFIHVSGDDGLLTAMYRQARAFVYPSMYEGFGLPPLEAMAQGCPVVCSNTSSIPEVVGNAGEFFLPSDVESMRIAIERVVFEESRRSELKALGYARIKEFSWERCAEQTLQVYERVK